MKIGNVYLVFYNFAMTIGWSYVLFTLAQTYLEPKTSLPQAEVYKNISEFLNIFQSGAILEVLHSLFGLVKSPIQTTLMQVSSRLLLIFVLHTYPGAQSTIFITSMVLAWSVTEIIRYSYYGFNLLNIDIYILTWLRYTLFFVLYPLGVGSEIACIVTAQQFMHGTFQYGPVDFYHFSWIAIAAYLPGFPKLYLYMISQRKKVLYPKSDTDKKSK